MNYDPVRYCLHCGKMKPRDGFKVLLHTKNRRSACADCYDVIMARVELKREERKGTT